MVRSLLRIANCLVWIASYPLVAAPPTRLYTVENYDVSLRVDLAKQRVFGEASIRFHSRVQIDVSALDLDAGGLQIKSVAEGTAPQWFERNNGALTVMLTHPLHPDEQRTIDVLYEAGPAAGLKFFPDQVYTSITSDWIPCNDRPDERAKLHLTIASPLDTKAAGSGQLTATRAGEGQSITE